MISFEILSAFQEREYNKYKFDAGVWIIIIIAFLDWPFLFWIIIKNNWPVIENSRERCDVKKTSFHIVSIGQLNTLCIS